MAKAKAERTRSVYRCEACGHLEAKWLGRCPACQEWSSLIEQPGGGATRTSGAADGNAPQPVTEVAELSARDRITCGIAEFDRVLGGGLVPGSLVLLGGDPGVGKSTLLTQALGGIARAGRPVLYASGEESVAQTALRARRLGAGDARLQVVAETDVDKILGHARALRPAVLAIDSIQTVFTAELDGIPGSVGQVRESAARIQAFTKTTGIPTVLVGHVTKDGGLAGPKTLEHLVDVVLQFEGDRGGPYRLVRAHKNRFGSTQEVGVFEMRGAGLAEVANPSASLLAERPVGAPGSVVVASIDGHRPLLVEVQGLVAPCAGGPGRRTAAGVDGNRVSLLLAVLAQRATCDVLGYDVFVNVAGGLHLYEPAVDLGVALAIASSARGRAVDAHTVVFGEIGLAGEIRAVPQAEARLAEARRLGFQRAILPVQNRAHLTADPGLTLIAVDRLSAAIDAIA
ncbi:MAG: DNA repair protein RadA [Kofleriaceae bacterium]|jgi:DNA repair protein RadA/Sms|nr:DNA repair protein RadA [Kofleriaceae bacterium]MBP6840596.1 DNA repair protein RadA [Kofleriaceae bacterium]MBP9203814.1 DNA repair protein RadA [Kofleriaceae bacterium]